jgi:CHRD domain-containing protein
MRKVALLAVLGSIGVLSVGAVAAADDDDGSGRNGARLNGYQEVTSISTTGFGSLHLRINRGGDSVDYVLSYRDLESTVTQAHIHFAQRAQNGGIIVWLCDNPDLAPAAPAGTPACSGTSGTASGTFDAGDVLAAGRGIDAGEWDEALAAIKVGHTYGNVHTTGWPGGEIRGQINDRDQKEYTGPPPFGPFGGDHDDD